MASGSTATRGLASYTAAALGYKRQRIALAVIVLKLVALGTAHDGSHLRW